MSEPVPKTISPVEEVMAFRIKMGLVPEKPPVVPQEILAAVAKNRELAIQQYGSPLGYLDDE